ncbi:hypothetical protein B0H17DRAFT_1192306 [Mycena rosella]|uniref:Uncharacterized protein n=1 Tax=Mycena rosella TaxID=1033263 RepID=A0AAD7GWI6_MYCRO|nr:hypothetical protein B0H17DRAFT_1192306 [Mycena rosella]
MAAHKYFTVRFPWNTWDPRVVRLFTEHGLRDSKDKDGNFCVIRKCPTIHEASAFQVHLEITWDAEEQVAKLSDVVPIHVVFGENIDMVPQIVRDGILDKTKGRVVDSIKLVPDVGHTIVQEHLGERLRAYVPTSYVGYHRLASVISVLSTSNLASISSFHVVL